MQNAHFLAKIGFDTAENETAKKLQDVANFVKFANVHSNCEARAGGHPSGCPHRAGLILSKKKKKIIRHSQKKMQNSTKKLKNRKFKCSVFNRENMLTIFG